MKEQLKLTITAVGEPDSIFLTPCEPVTLFESQVERPSAQPGFDTDEEFEAAADALAALSAPEVVILADEPPLPRSHRQAS
ncbi:MAG: hypothetical protein AAFX76_03380 [Planctomycetota bacterium]